MSVIDEMPTEVAKELAASGFRSVQSSPVLAEEVRDYVKALVDNRPASILESESVAELTMLAGVTLGLGLAKSNAEVEKFGGIDGLVTELANGANVEDIINRLRG